MSHQVEAPRQTQDTLKRLYLSAKRKFSIEICGGVRDCSLRFILLNDNYKTCMHFRSFYIVT